MKIIIDAREYGSSTGTYIRNLIEGLQKIDFKNTYILLLKSKDFEACPIANKNFVKLKCNIKEFSLAEQIKLPYLLYKLKADLVHFGMPQQPFLYFKRKITTVHDLTTLRFINPSKNYYVFKFKQMIYWLMLHWIALTSKHILTPTNFVRKDLIKFNKLAKNKASVTYEAADAEDEKAEVCAPLKNQDFIMFIGRPQPHKNLRRLIDAFSILKKNHPELKLALAGKDDAVMKSHLEYASKMLISDVILTGWITQGQKVWMYQNCQAYVFPSLSEGFGLPGLEAFQFGAPLVSSNATCLPEVYGDAAHYFNPTDVNDMATKINDVLKNKKLALSLMEKGKIRLKKFSWAKMAEETLEKYNANSTAHGI
jgi:glycosyltransferase involved in cell wall biosynthesis